MKIENSSSLGTGKNKMKNKAHSVPRDLRCQKICDNISRILWCVPGCTRLEAWAAAGTGI